jgi:hypothetical protein
MESQMRRTGVLFASAALLALPACGTQEIGPGPGQTIHAASQPSPEIGALMFALAGTADTLEQEEAQPSSILYNTFVDGKLLILDHAPAPTPVTIAQPSAAGAGYLPAGPHHVALAAPGASAAIFEGDGEIAQGMCTEIFLFSRLGVLQGRWLSVPVTVGLDSLHVAVINLVRDGRSIEVVSCPTGGACTPISAPLALGDAFEGDFARADLAATGLDIGWRQVPSLAVPTPPVVSLTQVALRDMAPFVGGAPLYLDAQGVSPEDMPWCEW